MLKMSKMFGALEKWQKKHQLLYKLFHYTFQQKINFQLKFPSCFIFIHFPLSKQIVSVSNVWLPICHLMFGKIFFEKTCRLLSILSKIFELFMIQNFV